MKKPLTEFVGTFFLVFTIGLVVLGNQPMAPLAIGAMLCALVYMGGHISGAHYNPAVSLAFRLRGKLSNSELVSYVTSQVLGALAGAAVVYFITGQTFAPAPNATASIGVVLLVEALFTFALALVVLNVATHKSMAGHSSYGLAIGFTVMAGAFAAGGISGAAFNPAVGIGPIVISALFGGGSAASLWIYLVGPLVGGAMAAVVFGIQEE